MFKHNLYFEAASDNGGGDTAVVEEAPGVVTDNGPADGLMDGGVKPEAPNDPGQVADPSKAPSPIQRPPEIGEQFWDSVKGEIKSESLVKAYNDGRSQNNKLLKQLDSKGEVPLSPEDYLKNFQPPHRARPKTGEKEGAELSRYRDIAKDDPLFKSMAKAAKNAGLSSVQFEEFNQTFMETYHDHIPEKMNPDAEKAILGDNSGPMIEGATTYVNGLYKSGFLNEDEYGLMRDVGASALGIQLLLKLREESGEKAIPTLNGGQANMGTKTPAECSALLADPRYNQDGPVGDAYRAEVDKEFAKTHGTSPS